MSPLKSLFGGNERKRDGQPDRRASRRVELPLPVKLRLEGSEPRARRLHDVSLLGLSVDDRSGGQPGQTAIVQFEGYPGISKPFALACRVVREEGDAEVLALHIDRHATPAESLKQYRRLVAHYIRHRPLLEDLLRGFFEGRCEKCAWLGRVGVRKPRCPKCRGTVVPATAG